MSDEPGVNGMKGSGMLRMLGSRLSKFQYDWDQQSGKIRTMLLRMENPIRRTPLSSFILLLNAPHLVARVSLRAAESLCSSSFE